MRKNYCWTKCDSECPVIRNHSATLVGDEEIYCIGGYDGQKNHAAVNVYNTSTRIWHRAAIQGDAFPARNGHTATLIDNKIWVIGGWLGQGNFRQFASEDIFYLDIQQQNRHRFYNHTDRSPLPFIRVHKLEIQSLVGHQFAGG